MVKELLRVFLAGALAGLVNTFVAGFVIGYIPLPPLISNVVVLGILVMVIDYILRQFLRF